MSNGITLAIEPIFKEDTSIDTKFQSIIKTDATNYITTYKEYISQINEISKNPVYKKLVGLDGSDLKKVLLNPTEPIGEKKQANIDRSIVKLPSNTQITLDKFIKFIYIDITLLSDLCIYLKNSQTNRPNLYKIYDYIFNHVTYIKLLKKTPYSNDITNYNFLSNSSTSSIYISNFIDLLQKYIDNYSIVKNDYLDHVFSNIIDQNKKDSIDIISGLNSIPTNNIQVMNDHITKYSNDNIITFLKIRNNEADTKLMNERFKIAYNDKLSQMSLYYKFDNKKYYKLIDETDITKGIIVNDTIKPDVDFINKDEAGISYVTPKFYNNRYLFGDFTKIFLPDKKNADIVNDKDMDLIINAINLKKPVFMLGYGASGAGKTSSLIYYKGGKDIDEKNGILIHLCKKLAERGYKKIQIKCKEYYNKDIDKSKAQETDNITNEQKYIEFEYKESDFVLIEQYDHKNIHISGIVERQTFEKGASLGEVMIYLIDTDRLVKATTNNPNSSRSHSLVFVKLISDKDKDNGCIIIGDFAGVENVFNCGDPKIIGDFSNIRSDKLNVEGEAEFYYEPSRDLVPAFNPYLEQYNVQDEWGIDESMQNFLKENDNLKYATTIAYHIIKKYRSKYNDFIEELNKIFKYENDILNNLLSTKDTYLTIQKDSQKYKDIITTYLRINLRKNEMPISRDNYSNLIIQVKKYIILLKDIFHETGIMLTANCIVSVTGYEQFLPNDSDSEYIKVSYSKNVSANKTKIDTLLFIYKNQEIDIDEFMQKHIYKNINTDIVNEIYNKEFDSAKTEDTKVRLIEQAKEFVKKNMEKYIQKESYTKLIEDINIQIQQQIEKSSNVIQDKNIQYNNNLIDMQIKLEIPNNIIQICETVLYEKKIEKINDISTYRFEKKPFGSYDSFFDMTIETDTKNKTIKDNITEECNNRKNEGKYINDSLLDMRNVIKHIIYEKNKSKISVTPQFIDMCLQKYCPDKNKACLTVSSDDKTSLQSTIFKGIIDYLKELDSEKYKEDKDVYDNLLVSIFCVFNISRIANNPPPLPYIDINKIKQLFFSMEYIKDSGINVFVTELEKILKIIEIIPSLKDLYDVDFDVTNMKRPKLIPYIKEYIVDKKNTFYNQTASQDLINKSIIQFINMIDKSNAVSAIGTLEFLDQIAKFDTVKTLCQQSDDLTLENIKQHTENFKQLYKSDTEDKDEIKPIEIDNINDKSKEREQEEQEKKQNKTKQIEEKEITDREEQEIREKKLKDEIKQKEQQAIEQQAIEQQAREQQAREPKAREPKAKKSQQKRR